MVALVGTACIPRDTSQIVLDREASVSGFGVSWELDFYRNSAYGCGLSGNYTFLVMNPGGHADATAPLLVYLHGGGGYFDDQGDYHAVRDQTEDTWNHEETFDDLWQRHIRDMVLDAQDQPVDNTLKRRIEEGYRVLVVSMCDHDLYSGLGSEYPNNPVGGEVNGLQATMAAVDYTVANYPTTHVFAQGTSAGSAGVFALAASFAHEGTPLTGVVADSTIITPRLVPLNEVFAGEPGFTHQAGFEPQGVTDKVQFFVDPDIPAYPRRRLATATPAIRISPTCRCCSSPARTTHGAPA